MLLKLQVINSEIETS